VAFDLAQQATWLSRNLGFVELQVISGGGVKLGALGN